MAFVDITEPNSPLGVENILHLYKRGKDEITSDVCLSVLRATNYARNLRDMLDCMAKLSDEQLGSEGFKEVLLAILDGREQPESVTEKVKQLANRGGYADFIPAETIMKPSEYGQEALRSHFGREKILYLKQEDMCNADFADYDRLVLPDMADGKYSFISCQNFPKDIDASAVFKKIRFDNCELDTLSGLKTAEKAEFYFSDKMVADGDYTKCMNAVFYHINFKDGAVPKFAEGSKVYIEECIVHPQTDVSQIVKLDISGINDGNDLKNMVFRDGAEVYLSPEYDNDALPVLDFSRVQKLWLNCWDMSAYSTLPLRDGATVSFGELKNIPENLDCSRLDDVTLDRPFFTAPPVLQFKNGAKVNLNCVELAGMTDVTSCTEVRLGAGAMRELLFYEYGKVEELNVFMAQDFGSKENFTGCKHVKFNQCDVKQDCRGIFDEDAVVEFTGGYFNGVFDCGKCAEVVINNYNSDLLKIKTAPETKIRGNVFDQRIYATEVFKRFDEVILTHAIFEEKQKELAFKDGAKVVMTDVQLPEKIDMSGCDTVECSECTWSFVRHARFPDEATYLKYKPQMPPETQATWGKFSPVTALKKSGRE